ncbi:Uncharacterised protein [Shewanella baltica]|uniref:hypothetical protein n=1 Tax=Shewanella baltica TaxID=62322 RepID=UPI000F6C7C7C|nr:hypothetical protein [Shewanella baltica]VEF25189.1 Uncharacterised protein [Shewanella baltica]
MKNPINKTVNDYFGVPVIYESIKNVCRVFDCTESALFSLAIYNKIQFCVFLRNIEIKDSLKDLIEGLELNASKDATLSQISKHLAIKTPEVSSYNFKVKGIPPERHVGICLDGVFSLHAHQVADIQKYKTIEINEVSFVYPGEYYFSLSKPIKINLDDIIILNHDLDRIIQANTTASTMSHIFFEETEQQLPIKKEQIHGNAIRFGGEREEILSFALYVKHEFPEQCTTVAKWIETIDEKALLKWPETGQPPQSRDAIRKLLNKSLNIKS